VHLEEKINFLKYKINQYKKEKEDLTSIIERSENEKVKTLENEIRGYKNMTEGCIRSCNTLTEEIMQVRSEIERYNNINKNLASNSQMKKKK
jgi:hypothetical protein